MNLRLVVLAFLAFSVRASSVRGFIRDEFYAGKLPNGLAQSPRQVVLEGVLFYDLWHLPETATKGPGGGRGSKCSVRTLWELHPVTAIRLLN